MRHRAVTLRVATYNIHRSMGADRRVDDARILDVILGLDADLIALQEVESPLMPSPEYVSLMERLRHRGYQPILGTTLYSEHAAYGNALLSRLPIAARRQMDLSYPGREPRGLIEVLLDLGDSCDGASGRLAPLQLRCLATHLGLSAAERNCQMVRLSDRLARLAGRPHSEQPTILLGDFNEWRRHPGRLSLIDSWLRPTPIRSTFPSFLPLLPLDRVWYGGGLTLDDLEVVKTPSTRVASDHLPLRVDFRVGAVLAGEDALCQTSHLPTSQLLQGCTR